MSVSQCNTLPPQTPASAGRIDAAFVRYWAALYPATYDQQYYSPFIALARNGDVSALRRVTEWKNVGTGPRPMPLARTKQKAFSRFIAALPTYLNRTGKRQLRRDFERTAPVYSIFWYHVLYDRPIFDVHTNRAFQWFSSRALLRGRAAKIPYGGGHWRLYSRYVRWFIRTLRYVQRADSSISSRDLDRALFAWGKHYA